MDSSASGFTIVELMLATAVFSLVLIGALAGFLRTGNLFYKGVTLTQTQASAKQVLDDVSNNISDSTGVGDLNNSGYTYYCIGDTRYTYTYQTVTEGSAVNYGNQARGGNFGVIKDQVTNCPTPCWNSCPSGTYTIDGGTELLAPNMRVSQFLVCKAPGTSNLWNINIAVVYNTNTSSSGLDPGSAPVSCPAGGGTPTYTAPSCQGGTSEQQFCAVSNLSTSVFAGLSP